jgi:hypothetical protein
MWDIDPETMESIEPEPIRGNTEWAFTAYDNPSEGDWVSGENIGAYSSHASRCLIGPEGVKQLIPDIYTVWIRITNPPEKIVQRVGKLTVY